MTKGPEAAAAPPAGRFTYTVTHPNGGTQDILADAMSVSGGGVAFSVDFGKPTGLVVVRVIPAGGYSDVTMTAIGLLENKADIHAAEAEFEPHAPTPAVAAPAMPDAGKRLPALRNCLRAPIPEIEEAAGYLDAAVTAHLQGDRATAAEMFKRANMQVIWDWTDSLWGKKNEHNRPIVVADTLPILPEDQRFLPRNPTALQRSQIHHRDGHYCRFCGIPVIRAPIRDAAVAAYPESVSWTNRNTGQHAAFQCMWAQYDHIVPHARGGRTELDNLILTCAGCNFGKEQHTLEQMRLINPMLREPRRGDWDGLERFLGKAAA